MAVLIGELTELGGVEAHDVGNIVGETVSVAVLALLIRQLQVSISERDVLQASLTELAHHDPLTGLPNRRLFEERLDAAVSRAQTGTGYAVLMLDLDDFKAVNDSYGHEIGDEVLRVVARRVARCLRAGDLVARLGGDEFVVLVEDNADPSASQQLAHRIVTALSEPIALGDLVITAGVSIGIALGSADTDAFVREADQAMYAAKTAAASVLLAHA